jgi:hypothetical protein
VQKLLEDHKDVASEHGHWKKVKEKRGITVHLRHEEVPHLPATFFSAVSILFFYLSFFWKRRGIPSRRARRVGSSQAARSCSSASSSPSTTILVLLYTPTWALQPTT